MSTQVIEPAKSIEPVEPGTEWEWLFDVECRDGSVQPRGSIARVLARTPLAPHGEVMARGYNLLVEAANGTTVWATFEQCVSRGLLRRKASP